MKDRGGLAFRDPWADPEEPPHEAGDGGPGEILLAVDLGLRCGLAWYQGGRGWLRLLRYRCTELHGRARLRAAVPGILREIDGVSAVIGEGDRSLWAVWAREAGRIGAEASWVRPEDWRRGLWGPESTEEGKACKARARQLATGGEDGGLIGRLGARAAQSVRTDAAEAVCIGYWAALQRGWGQEVGR